MTLSDKAEGRLANIIQLQPMRNKELQNRWGLESGSEVHHYLESKLKDYYYRDDNSFIHATAETAELVGVEPGVGGDDEAESVPSVIHVPSLGTRVFKVAVSPDERPESVVSVLSKLRDKFDIDSDVDDMHHALQGLRRKDAIEVVYRAVPTPRLVVERGEVGVEVV